MIGPPLLRETLLRSSTAWNPGPMGARRPRCTGLVPYQADMGQGGHPNRALQHSAGREVRCMLRLTSAPTTADC